jgi:hypothetical protein
MYVSLATVVTFLAAKLKDPRTFGNKHHAYKPFSKRLRHKHFHKYFHKHFHKYLKKLDNGFYERLFHRKQSLRTMRFSA